MKLYNTRSRLLETLTPLEDNHVRIYSCGPTVYDQAHIGNLSAYIYFDTLRRAVQSAGYRTTYAMNYTDVDDKTIRRSREQYPDQDPKLALKTLTDHYIKLFLHDMQAIGNDTQAVSFLRATDPAMITGMQQLISKLLEGGFAYIASDGIYFSIDAYRRSGKVYGQLLELTLSNTSEARIQNDEYDKASAHDFALWKIAKDHEPSWPFQIQDHDLTGRPGWHIECSVMSRQALGQPFDIHTGGVDLIFPHHENEIAQSTAGEANPLMASIFVHNEHILVDGQKMAKSAKNFYTLQDIVAKGYDPVAFRLLVLQSHYRSQAHFSWDNLLAAQQRLQRWRAVADQRWQISQAATSTEKTAESSRATLLAALQNDLDTPQALRAIDHAIEAIEQSGLSASSVTAFTALLKTIGELLGIDLLRKDLTPEQKQLIADRESARDKRDWARADQLRKQLEEAKISLNDTPAGPVWHRT